MDSSPHSQAVLQELNARQVGTAEGRGTGPAQMNTSAVEPNHCSEQRLPCIILSQTHARKPTVTYTRP